MSENKLQVRARLLSAIIGLQNNSADRNFVGKTLTELRKIENKSDVLDILQKEFLKENSQMRDYTIGFLIKELVPQESIENTFYSTLANPKISDMFKAKLVSLLRECGKHVNYEEFINYFDNPEEIIDADTVRLLEDARINPESQIDFMDFLTALPTEEKNMLVTSLSDDYSGDNLANILTPIILTNPYSEIAQSAIKAMGESKSKLAYPVLQWLSENVQELTVLSHIQKSMSLLKLSGIKEDVTSAYYKKLLACSPVYKCFVNYPDGHGNIGMIFSRKNEAEFIQMFTVVINDTDGIIDCFGFNEISEDEFDRIVNKFYQNDTVVQVDESLCKYLLDNAEKISRLKFADISYEYICWSTITKDIEYEEPDFDVKRKICETNDFLLKQLYEKEIFDKWFFEYNDNNDFAKLIEELIKNSTTDTKEIEKLISLKKVSVFDPTFMKKFDYRLKIMSFFALLNEENAISDMIYALIPDSATKDKFLTDIIKKSVYEYFLSQKDKYDNMKNATSIFKRKTNKELENINIQFVEQVIKNIESNWL